MRAAIPGRRASPERLKAIAENSTVPRVRVLPKNDAMRRLLRHANGTAFRKEGSVEWPLDRWTQKRLRDGDITIEREVDAARARGPEQETNAGRERGPEPGRAPEAPRSPNQPPQT
jgi:hypothetical protein